MLRRIATSWTHTDRDYSGRSYETYLHPVSELGAELSLGAIKIKVITLQYKSLEVFEHQLRIAISTVRVCFGNDPVAQEHCEVVSRFLTHCISADAWEAYDRKHQVDSSNVSN